ncbi:hypothetical protein MMC30_003913 [Trapelia coarctata]|nr:hypothetical protein [Trapelia coarctata]
MLPLHETIAVTAGALCLTFYIPERGEHQGAFDEALNAYHDDVRQAVPHLAGLGFSEEVMETPLVVLGKRDRVQYIIDKEGDIGSGAFGIVSKALDPITGNLYAAKKFPPHRSRITLKEIDIHCKTSHEHIVRVVDVQEDLPLLIMEYAPLGNLLQQEGFSLSETVIMLEQQLKAVNYLHAEGLTHRDIKPENILVDSRYPELSTKLSHFGLSSDRSELKTFCGTELYAAPEVTKNGTRYTNAVDIWSLGVVALQMAYGVPKPLRKWDAQDWADEVHHHARKQSEPKRNIKVPRMREGQKCIQGAKDHPSELPQIAQGRWIGDKRKAELGGQASAKRTGN